MTLIRDVETAVDLIGKTSTEIQSNSRLKIGSIAPEDNIDLLFAVDDGGFRVPLRNLMLCPFNGLKVCKLQRCLAYDTENSVCTLFKNNQGHNGDRKSTNEKSKEAHLLNDFVDALHKEEDNNKGIPKSPPNLPSLKYTFNEVLDEQ